MNDKVKSIENLNLSLPNTILKPHQTSAEDTHSNISIAHITTIDAVLHFLLYSQLQEFVSEGYDVIGISSEGPHTRDLVASGIQHIPVTIARNIQPLKDMRSLWQLYWILKKNQFTIVHTHNPKPGLIGQIAAYLAGVPIIVNTIHGFYFHDLMPPLKRRFFILLEKIAAQCSDLILSQNKEDLETAIREGICSPNKIRYLGNGIDVGFFSRERLSISIIQQKREELGLPKNVSIVGFVGRLAAKRKGFLDFLAAAQSILTRHPDTHFLIVGTSDTGKDDAVDPAIAQDYGIAEHCCFAGFRPKEEMPEHYALMNILVLPSLFEGVPRAVMEASSMGIPVVATDVKGNREAVIHNHTGLLVPYGEPEKLADAIDTIFTHPELATQMGIEGRKLVCERFNEKQVIERIKIEYRRLLQENC